MDTDRNCTRSRSIVLFAAQSRIFVFILQCLFNYLIPDHNAKVFNPGFSKNVSLLDRITSHFFDGLTARWDGIYFMHIAEHGYTYENTLVFFPLFPFLTNILANYFLFPLHYFLSFRNVLHVAATLLNFVAFLSSAYFLYRLGHAVTRQEHLAYRAAQLFCVNPASVFFSAAYSESLFSALTFAGLLKIQEHNYLKASCFFALSGATRSNGIINVGFILYSYLTYWYRTISSRSIDYKFNSSTMHSRLISKICIIIWELFSLLLCILVSVSLFLSHQAYCYFVYCHEMKDVFMKGIPEYVVEYGKVRGYKVPGYGPEPSWCQNEFPFSYSKIQEQHWNIGLFKYYKLIQLPNFLLALPMLVISVSLCTSYFVHKPLFCLLLGMVPQVIKSKKVTAKRCQMENDNDYTMVYFYQDSLYVYVVQLGVLTIFGSAYMHIQVITRMICSSCPVFYWYVAEKCMTKEERMAMKIMHQRQHVNLLNKWEKGCFICEGLYCGQENTKNVMSTYKREILKVHQSLNFQDTDKIESAMRSRPVVVDNSNDKQVELLGSYTIIANDFEAETLMEVFKESEVIDWNNGLFNRFVSIYFHLFLFVGVAAFANFFPWT